MEQNKKKRRRRKRSRRPARPRFYAAVDLGTNNCRLLIATPTDGGKGGEKGKWRIVDSFSRVVRLGEKIATNGYLSEAAMTRTLEALKICAERIKAHRGVKVRAVATEACRQASNAEALIERVAHETGLQLEIVEAEEEARLAALGCAPLIGAHDEGALVFDIGGGSTEAIWLKREEGEVKLVHFASVSAGVMTLAEMNDGQPYAELRARMLTRFAEVRKEMDAIGGFDPTRNHLLGTSGTVTTLAGIALNLPRYVRSRVDGTWHQSADMLKVVQKLIGMSREERAMLGCVGEERADLILPGCAIYEAIAALWPCERLRVADRGLREGILRDMMMEKTETQA